MKGSLAAVLAILLLVGAGLVIAFERAGGDSETTEQGATGPPGAGAHAGRGSKGERLPRNGNGSPASQLRDYRATATSAPPYSVIEGLTKRLSDEDLHALVREKGGSRPDGLAGWVRCSLFAELGRREGEQALVFLQSDAMFDYGTWAWRQAWVSVFRGWAEIDPGAAAARLADFVGPRNRTGRVQGVIAGGASPEQYRYYIKRDVQWVQQAHLAVFENYARRNPQAAWEALPPIDILGLRLMAMKGLFRGVEGEDHVRELLGKFTPEWNVQAESLTLEASEPSGTEPRLNDEHVFPDRESVGVEAAHALFKVDPSRALEWIRTAGPGDDLTHGNRERLFYELLAERQPEPAVSLLGADVPRGEFLLTALLRAHPERASEWLPLADNEDHMLGALVMAMSGRSRLMLEDLFPAPGRNNRLPNYEARYRGLLQAVRQAKIDPEQRALLESDLHEEFAEVVPAARTARQGDEEKK